jgi:hypothetical protein
MPITRYREGNTTVVLHGDLEGHVRRAMEAANATAVAKLEGGAQEIADDAEAAWYGGMGVTRRTGKSGDIEVVTTVDASRDEVRVGVGSVDTRTVQAGKLGGSGANGGKKRVAGGRTVPLAAFVHRPWRTTLRAKAVEQAEWWAWKRKDLPVLPPPGDPWWGKKRDGKRNGEGLDPAKWYVLAAGAAQGKVVADPGTGYLLADYVRKPARLKIKALAKTMAGDFVRRMGGR